MRRPSLANTIFSRPLATEEEDQQRLSAATGIPVFGLDALSSATYGPEAALTVLLSVSAAAALYILPITAAICVLLGVVYLSYRLLLRAFASGCTAMTGVEAVSNGVPAFRKPS